MTTKYSFKEQRRWKKKQQQSFPVVYQVIEAEPISVGELQLRRQYMMHTLCGTLHLFPQFDLHTKSINWKAGFNTRVGQWFKPEGTCCWVDGASKEFREGAAAADEVVARSGFGLVATCTDEGHGLLGFGFQ